MNVIYDTNVLISYLLTSEKEGTIATIIEAGFKGEYTICIPSEVIKELKEKIFIKEFLSQRIPKLAVERFILALSLIAIIPKPITEPIPEVGRDYKDDYLLAYGIIEECDYLVTGDEDLLVLKKIENLKIVSPLTFSKILKLNKR